MAFLLSHVANFNARSDSTLRSLGWLAIQSSSYTTAFAIIGATLAFCFPDGSLYANASLAFFPPLASFYACSLLATLNGRDRIRSRNAAPTGEANLTLPAVTPSGSHSRWQSGGFSGTGRSSHRAHGVDSILVEYDESVVVEFDDSEPSKTSGRSFGGEASKEKSHV